MQPVTPRRKVACPTCGDLAEYNPANPWRPFCSQRCKLIDLGQWATESYRIPENDKPSQELEDE